MSDKNYEEMDRAVAQQAREEIRARIAAYDACRSLDGTDGTPPLTADERVRVAKWFPEHVLATQVIARYEATVRAREATVSGLQKQILDGERADEDRRASMQQLEAHVAALEARLAAPTNDSQMISGAIEAALKQNDAQEDAGIPRHARSIDYAGIIALASRGPTPSETTHPDTEL